MSKHFGVSDDMARFAVALQDAYFTREESMQILTASIIAGDWTRTRAERNGETSTVTRGRFA